MGWYILVGAIGMWIGFWMGFIFLGVYLVNKGKED